MSRFFSNQSISKEYDSAALLSQLRCPYDSHYKHNSANTRNCQCEIESLFKTHIYIVIISIRYTYQALKITSKLTKIYER